MTISQPPADILRASVGADGRLLSADPLIAQLQAEAGGREDGPLLVPQLAALARLATRLNIPLSRPVVAARAEQDIDMWVRARPRDGVVELSIIDWHERAPRTPLDDGAARDADLMATGEGWWWQIDTQMRFIMADAPEDARAGPATGSKLTAYFQLSPDAAGDMPILRAFAERRPFIGQPAILGAGGQEYMLSAMPMFDAEGRLSGYRGKAVAQRPERVPTPPSDPMTPAEAPPGPLFGRRLDRALRQPLGRIIANADTISSQLEGPLRQDYAAYAADIATAGRHLMELVDDLADLQAIDRPDFTVASEEIDLADIARRAAGLLGVKATDRQIRIDPPQPTERLLATGEFRRALQILVNLIGNAVRYSPEGAMIWVRVEQDGDTARVIVADQGRGIAAEDQERIFEKFERLGRDEAGGSGLGLFISRRLARAMGGDIIVDSAPGQGARFTLGLPAQ